MKQLKAISIMALCMTVLSACVTATPKPPELSVRLDSHNIKIGEVEFQFDSIMGLGGLRKHTADVLYFPREDAVCIRYRRELFTYHQFWDQSGRLAFIRALRDYNAEYDARAISRNERRSDRKYGTARGYLIWQQAAFLIQARGNMDKRLGYLFKNRSPYFTVTQLSAEYVDELSRDSDRTSHVIVLYFTRAQAAEMAALFDPLFLMEHGSPGTSPDGAQPDSTSGGMLGNLLGEINALLPAEENSKADVDDY